MREPTLASLSSEPGVILTGDVTTVIYRDANGTTRAFQARADDPDFLAWERDQRERPGATTVAVDGVAVASSEGPARQLVDHGQEPNGPPFIRIPFVDNRTRDRRSAEVVVKSRGTGATTLTLALDKANAVLNTPRPIAEVFAPDDFKTRWLAEANARAPWAVADRAPSSAAYEDDIRTAIADVREYYGVDISRELARLFLPPPRVDVDIAHLAREMRKANPQQNRHERRANAAIGRRR